MTAYSEDNFLMLSGIQHIAFCERQWAFIHIEKQWIENVHTTEGQLLHKNVDNPALKEKRKDRIISRAVPVVSYSLGLYGIADVVEFLKTENPENAVILPRRKGYWTVNAVEYKKGKPKTDNCDKVQLCAQAMCLEEMYNISLTESSLFYGETKHREVVNLDQSIRKETEMYAQRMHALFSLGETPKAVYKKGCRACSFFDVCLPKMPKQPVRSYLQQVIQEEMPSHPTRGHGLKQEEMP